MKQDIANAISDDFLAHFRIVEPDDIRSAESILATIRFLPDPDEWVLAPENDDGTPKALLLAEDRLIELWAVQDDDGLRVKSESRPLVDAGVVIRLESFKSKTPDGSATHRTEWTFKFPGAYEVRVPGRVVTRLEPSIDDKEKFARAVAAKVGKEYGRVIED